MALRAEPHAAVACGPLRVRESGGEPAYGPWRNPRTSSYTLGGQVLHERDQCVEAPHAARKPAEAHPPLRNDHVQHGCKQQGIGARPDGEVLVGESSGLGAARVDDDHAPTARPTAVEAAAHVGSTHRGNRHMLPAVDGEGHRPGVHAPADVPEPQLFAGFGVEGEEEAVRRAAEDEVAGGRQQP